MHARVSSVSRAHGAMGAAPATRLAGPLAACFALAFALLVALPMQAHAETVPGLVETKAGDAAYADVLASEMSETVQLFEVDEHEAVALSGDFKNAWGAVTFSWDYCKSGTWKFLDDGNAASSDAVWENLSTEVLEGELPLGNMLMRPGGSAQTIEFEELDAGLHAFRLTASDDAGYTHAITWLVQVEPDSSSSSSSSSSTSAGTNASARTGTRTGTGTGTSSTGKLNTMSSSDSSEWSGSLSTMASSYNEVVDYTEVAGEAPVNSNTTALLTVLNSTTPTVTTSDATDSGSTSSLPKTNDFLRPLGIALVVVGALALAVCAIAAIRRMRSDKKA